MPVTRLTRLLPLVACFAAASARGAAPEHNWPTFRGPHRTAVSTETGLLTAWPEEGPKLLRSIPGSGRGYSSLAVVDGRIYTLGDGLSIAPDRDEYLVCFDQETGQPLWMTKTGPAWNEGNPGWQSSRSTPTVAEDNVYVITPQGVLHCCAVADGKEQWKKDLQREFRGTKADGWGYSESPLVDGDRVIVTPGAPTNTMVALNRGTGEVVWTASREGDRGAGHSSIVISEVGGVRVYVQTTGSGALGVRADDGELMWSYEIDSTTAVIPTPIVRDDLVFFTAGYGRGGALLRQIASGGSVTIDEIYGLQQRLANKHGGVVLVGDHLYGDSDDKGRPFCADLLTGEIAWNERGPGSGSAAIAAADGHLYIRWADGLVALVKANPQAYEVVSTFTPPGSGDRPSWAHPVISNGRLFLREHNAILIYDISADAAR
ncbi:MAG: PQQ-like beta-propeller repeat protein [Planctomyces sp.]|nr:PQQ-like beta-propeller repeat protein [Planctomyces sp.]